MALSRTGGLAASDFERVAGAVLVQQTRWENVDRVLREMRHRGIMSPEAVVALPLDELEAIVRPAGFYRNKARSLHDIARYMSENPDAFSRPADRLREELLTLRGVGDETADVLVLYVAGRPSFVVDGYARKTLKCLGIEGNYCRLRRLIFMKACLPTPICTGTTMRSSWSMANVTVIRMLVRIVR